MFGEINGVECLWCSCADQLREWAKGVFDDEAMMKMEAHN